ncbi:MAG: ABC transporter permease [Herpetosiphon sp.]
MAASLWEALSLLLHGDRGLWQIIGLSLIVSSTALLISMLPGIPLGVLLALRYFPGRRVVLALVYTGMGLPPVVVGLLVYLLLSRSGPLGALGLLFTPAAMVFAQVCLSFPLVAGLTFAALDALPPLLRPQLLTLGASRAQVVRGLIWEARGGIVVALVAGFGSVLSEVGAVMLVGGNIEGSTRVLTTAIVLETRTGNFERALALAAVLLTIGVAINGAILLLQHRLVTYAR